MEARMLQRALLLVLLTCKSCNTISDTTHVCNSLELRSVKDFEQLQNCTLVVGHVSLINIQLEANTSATLTSAVEEITDYLLVHRVEGLTTLRVVFPRLKLIRGRELLFERYSLVVYENRHLLSLGLVSLLRIQAGSIRIEANPLLCYVATVNWVLLLGNSTQQHFSLKRNKAPNQCPLCIAASNNTNVVTEDSQEALEHRCWDMEVSQQTKSVAELDRCPPECLLRGCDGRGRCCSGNCLSDCLAPKCTHCANFLQNHKCVDACAVPYYEFQKRECITAKECRERGLIPYARTCTANCPANFQQTPDSLNPSSCSLTCRGDYVVHTAKDLYSLRECVSIQGSLTIELRDIRSKVTDLEHALLKIKEITGYLRVMRSPQLMSLNFLRSLDTIRGEELIDNKYSLYVVDNHHLEQIWANNQNVAIVKGRIYFHLNPRLCYDKIMALEPTLKSVQAISIIDVSPNSNGERVVCGSAVRVLNVTVEDFNSTAARLKVEPMSADDKPMLIGYLHHYKEAPVQNVTLYDGRHGCGHDRWRMDISANQNVRHIISHLKPYTQYAFFVKTLTMTDYHMQIDAYSKIQYFRTLPSKPGPVAKIYYHALSSSKLVVHWWPPRILNGIIEKYIFSIAKAENKSNDTPKSKAIENTCECNMVNPEDSGPLPEDENYYNKEQIIYDEALPDLIYVSRPEEKGKLKRRENGGDFSNETDTNSTSITELTNSANIQSARMRRKASEGKSSNNINKFEKEHSKASNDAEVAEALRNYQKYRELMEKKALAEQDTGIKDFPITKPPPICTISNPTVQYQLENDCIAVERYDGLEIPGHIYSYTIDQLEPEMTYRIGVRACVAELDNACGSETVIYAETVSKSMEKFLQELKVIV